VLNRRAAWAVLVVATLTMTVSYVDRQAFSVLGPTVTKKLDISDFAYGVLQMAFPLAYLVATPIAGWWIDRVGARRGLVGSVLVWSAVAALHALVPGFAMLFVLRIALGLAEGPGFPGAAQTVQRVLPPGERARGFGILFTGSSIGGMLVPKLASWLYDEFGWRLAFLGTAVAGLLWVPLWLLVTGRRGVREHLDVAPASTGPKAKLGDIVRDPTTLRSLAAIFASAPIVGLALNWGAKYLVKTFSYVHQEDVGDYLWLPALCFDVGAILFGDLGSRFRRPGKSPRALFTVGMLMGLALVALPLAGGPWSAMGIVAVAMAGAGAMYTLVTADMLSRMPPESVSLAGGTIAGAQSIALIIMNPLVGAIVDRNGNYDAVAIGVGAWVLPGALVWLLARETR
jgi:MFS transporter, ACS family, aldohexuronate transporter